MFQSLFSWNMNSDLIFDTHIKIGCILFQSLFSWNMNSDNKLLEQWIYDLYVSILVFLEYEFRSHKNGDCC